MNISELQEKLKKLNISISARKISQIWGMDEASFSRKKRLGSEIKYENIKQLENELDINLTSNNNQENVKNTDSDIIKIPYWQGLPEELKHPEYNCVIVQRASIEKGWGVNLDDLCIIPMVGDKMTRYWYPIRNNDMLIIDTSKKHILGNGVYFAVSQNNTRFWVREMQVLYNNDIEFKGFAPSGNTTRVVSREELAKVDFKIIGKVIKNVSFTL